MNESRVCVAKLGGSLLASNELAPRLQRWLAVEMAAHGDTHYVLVVGGGPLVDAVRNLDAQHNFDTVAAHWACVELMDVTARLVAAMLPDVPVEGDYNALQERCRQPGATVFRPGRFLKGVEPDQPGTRLAEDWSVTSDSIAARLAIVLAADELVLVKSVPPPVDSLSLWERAGVRVSSDGRQPPVPDGSLGQGRAREQILGQLAAAGYVDAFLPRLARELPPLRVTTLELLRNDGRNEDANAPSP